MPRIQCHDFPFSKAQEMWIIQLADRMRAPLTQLPNASCVGPFAPLGGGVSILRGFKCDGLTLSGYSWWKGVGSEMDGEWREAQCLWNAERYVDILNQVWEEIHFRALGSSSSGFKLEQSLIQRRTSWPSFASSSRAVSRRSQIKWLPYSPELMSSTTSSGHTPWSIS